MTTRSTTDRILEDIGEGFGYLQAYVNDKIDAIRLETAEKAAKATSGMVTGYMIFSLANLVVWFAALALGFYLGEVLDSTALGFLIVAGFFLLLLIVMYVLRRTLITNAVISTIIKSFYKKD